MVEEIEAPNTPDQKRRKLTQNQLSPTAEKGSTKVGATELASAFALASLATVVSPGSTKSIEPAETRDVESVEEGGRISWDQHEGPAPISPDARSPTRHPNKRVHFAPNLKGSAARRIARPRAFLPRYVAQAQVSRMPPGFGRGGNYPTRRSMPPPWSMSPRAMGPMGFMPPLTPPPMMHRSASHPWICDYCNVASFATYQEACIHEESCRHRFNMPSRRTNMWHPMAAQSMVLPPQHLAAIEQEQRIQPVENLPCSSDRDWFEGSVPLSIKETDPEWLSETNCFLREKCVEAFSVTEEDAKSGRIKHYQVGIRCRYCKNRPRNERAAGAVIYPASIAGIYESVKRLQRIHIEQCEHTPKDVKTKLFELGSSNPWTPKSRGYWYDSAKALGMVDTDDGIRFGKDPNGIPDKTKIKPSQFQKSNSGGEFKEGSILKDGDYVVYPEDMNMVPAYVYFLMRQVENCHFTEADRFVARSKGPVGYPGFQCRHCNGHAGLGKYFPVSSKSLSTNSTSQNIHAHLLKCRKCPDQIKEQLLALKEEKSKAPRLEPGWRKVFFDKVWGRLHRGHDIC